MSSPDVYLQYSDGPTLRGHHEPIEVMSSKASRLMNKDSVVGKKWAEGDLQIDLDVVTSGYMFKATLGNELLETGTPNNHTFYTSVSGNTPKTATLIYSRGDTDVEQYAFAAIDELTLDVPNDGLATLTTSWMAAFPTTGAAQTVTVTSGTHMTFKDMEVRFGSTLSAAASASATAVNELSLSIANNLEVIHRSGSADVSTIRNKGFSVSGSYTLYFDSETDKNAYYNLNKRAMEITFTGNANEEIRIRVPRFRLNEAEVSTGLDDFYIVNAEFMAEDYVDAGVRLIDIRLQNDQATAY